MAADITHLHSLFENATEGIILTNGKGRIILVNPAACRMFDYRPEEITGQPIEILIPDSVRSHHHELRDGFYHKPSNRVMGRGRDLYGRKKGGTDLPVEVSLSYYHQQEEMFVIAFIVNITRRKEIEQNMVRQQKELELISNEIRILNAELEAKVEERTLILKEALQRLEQSQVELNEALDKERQLNEIKSRFVSMASHEFRTPLSTVLSSASLLGKYTTTDEQDKRTKHIERIKSSVKQLNDILEDFLSLGKLDEGKVQTQLTRFDLHHTLEELTEVLKPLLKDGQYFDLQYEGPDHFCSDEKLVKNILTNLITNAIKFSGEKEGIRIDAKADELQATVSVTDKGIGIAQEDLEHLFSSFFRGANAVNIQGTGLGLHIVRRYLDLIGGDITVESKLGEGSCFSITFLNHKSI
jgi:PAS domain S-box-containing protein